MTGFMNGYDDTIDTNDYNITIDGYQMIMEECTPNESYNRRETIRHNILGGTQSVMRGNYLPRDYTFTTHLLIDPEHPEVYDSTFKTWQSKPVTVSSGFMGGKFDAEIIIKRSPCNSPNYLLIEVQVIEIPTGTSLIPNDEFIIPGDKVVPIKTVSTRNSTKTKTTKTKNGKKGKDSKGKNSKGGKITKTKKGK